MRKRVLLLAFTSVLMSLCIPACAQQIQSDSLLTADMIAKVKPYVYVDPEVLELYYIEIGDISEETKARRQDRGNYTENTYKVPEGITVKELILSLPGIKRKVLGRLVAKKSNKTIRCIHFNSQWIIPDNTNHLYYTNDTKLKISPYAIDSPCRIYEEDTKLNKGTAFVKIKKKSSSRRRHGADIVIEYYQDAPYDMVGGNSDYVDLGLSVKWATRNVGAAGPEEIGGFYRWGETEPKHYLDFSKYYGADGKIVLDLEDDVAHVKWGGGWRMPTTDEIIELIENCTWTWASVKGEIGFLITSNKPGYTDRSIFLPYYYAGSSGEVGYWSGSFNANSNDIDCTASLWICFDGYMRSGYCYRHWQLPVRPVCE